MTTTSISQEAHLARFGFRFGRGGAHQARSMMLAELRLLFQHRPDDAATSEELAAAVLQDNCLGKRSAQTRELTLRHLRSLYGLDPAIPVYRTLRYFWQRDPGGQPLLACLVAFVRDPVLRLSAPYILRCPQGESFDRTGLEQFLDAQSKGRFSKATLQSTAQNLAATWTHAGHLRGRVRKIRDSAVATPGSVSLALLLGYISGLRGQTLFESDYAKLLDCPLDCQYDLAQSASRAGWIVFKHSGSVVEVLFPSLLTAHEKEWVREQS